MHPQFDQQEHKEKFIKKPTLKNISIEKKTLHQTRLWTMHDI